MRTVRVAEKIIQLSPNFQIILYFNVIKFQRLSQEQLLSNSSRIVRLRDGFDTTGYVPQKISMRTFWNFQTSSRVLSFAFRSPCLDREGMASDAHFKKKADLAWIQTCEEDGQKRSKRRRRANYWIKPTINYGISLYPSNVIHPFVTIGRISWPPCLIIEHLRACWKSPVST